MGRIVNTEKLNIGIPNSTGVSMRRDAELFEFFKSNGKDLNLNGFLSALIVGYYQGYKQELNESVNVIREIVTPYLHDKTRRERLIGQVMEEIVLPSVPKRKGKNPIRFSLKPTLDTDQIITEITSEIGSGDSTAQYLCRMFMSYCEKPTYERERIIFRKNVIFLEEACKDHSEVSFATTNNPKIIHHVIPYEIAVGSDETFNYLIGQEFSTVRNQYETVSYHLCRINHPGYHLSSGILQESVIQHLEMMKKYGAQYAINDDTETCVRMTPQGKKSFQAIYFGRPTIDRIEEQQDGSALYYFRSPQALLYRYFLRFNAGEAEVLYPNDLRNQIIRYYREALAAYVDNEAGEGKKESPSRVL